VTRKQHVDRAADLLASLANVTIADATDIIAIMLSAIWEGADYDRRLTQTCAESVHEAVLRRERS